MCNDTNVKNRLGEEQVYSHHRHLGIHHLSWFWKGAEGKLSSSLADQVLVNVYSEYLLACILCPK